MMMDEPIATYRKDRYYINWRLGAGLRSERIVPGLYWWLIRVLAGRRYMCVTAHSHVLYERDLGADGDD